MILPTNWNEVTLQQYIKVVEVSSIDMDELDKQIRIISILSGIDEDKLLNISLPSLKEAIRAIQFIYNLPKPKGVKTTITIGLNKFEINTNIKSLTSGEYIDLAELTKDKGSVTSNLPNILAIFFKPINWFGFPIKKYYKKNVDGNLIQTLESRARTINILRDNLMMGEVISLSSFFLSNWNCLMEATLHYSEQQNKKMAEQLNKAIDKDLRNFGDGI